MRKFFLGLMLSSALGAIVIGSAMAWTGSTIGSDNATGGVVAVTFDHWVPTNVKLVPSNDWQTVVNGGLKNTGDVAVHVTGGSVGPFAWSGGKGPHADYCNDNTHGNFVIDNSGNLNPGADAGNLYHADVNLDMNADDDCQNATLNYGITVTVGT